MDTVGESKKDKDNAREYQVMKSTPTAFCWSGAGLVLSSGSSGRRRICEGHGRVEVVINLYAKKVYIH